MPVVSAMLSLLTLLTLSKWLQVIKIVAIIADVINFSLPTSGDISCCILSASSSQSMGRGTTSSFSSMFLTVCTLAKSVENEKFKVQNINET
jgi:hypothetical protein